MSFHLFIRNVSCASCSACRKDFLSGKRVRPKEIGFCRLPHLKWKLGYEIGFLLFGFFGNSSPSLVQTDGLFAGDATAAVCPQSAEIASGCAQEFPTRVCLTAIIRFRKLTF